MCSFPSKSQKKGVARSRGPGQSGRGSLNRCVGCSRGEKERSVCRPSEVMSSVHIVWNNAARWEFAEVHYNALCRG